MTASYLSRAPDSGCFPGTRKTLLNQISTWFNEARAPQIFWLSGLGGTGKTAVSHTVCETLHTELGANFFFSRDEADRRRVASIIPTLAYQLASVNATYRRKLCDVLKKHPDAPSRAQQYQLRELLLHPLKDVPSLPPYLIILDALDECDKERGTEGGDLIPLILRELLSSGLNIKVLITSRPERSIREMFKVTGGEINIRTTVLHDMDQTAVKEDIASYLAYHLQCIQVNRNIQPPWPGDEAFNDLVECAGLFFIHAATIVNFVADTYYSPRNQLQRLLASRNTNTQSPALYSQVDILYLQVLKASVEGRADASELCARFRKIVGGIILLQNPLSISALAQLLGHDEADLEGALTPLHSLFDVPSNHDQPVRIFHPSFRAFLSIQERCQDPRFTIPEGRTHAHLAFHCLEIMIRSLKRNICGIDNDTVLNSEIPDLQSRLRDRVSPALLYACQYWGDHLSLSTNDTELQKKLVERMSEFASTKLLYWVEVLSLEGRFPLCISNLVTLASFSVKEVIPGTYHLIYDAYRLVLDFHNVINISAVQVYNSALIFIPDCSLLHAYEHELPTAHMTTPRTEEWDASLLVLEGHKSSVNMVSISQKGGRVASASDDGCVCIWDTSNGAQVSCFNGHVGAVKSVDYSPNSAYLVSSGSDATIRLWNAITGFNMFTFIGHKGSVNLAIFSSDRSKIASGSDDNTISTWDVLENKPLSSLNGHSGPVTCLAFLANDSQILSGSMDCTLRLWDTRTQSTLKVLHCTDAVLCLSISSSSQKSMIFSGSQSGVIITRDAGTLEEIGHFVGGTAAVKSLGFSSQVNEVVSSSSDGVIRLWDPARGFCVAEYRGHFGSVECTKFTPDGTHILSSSADRTIRLWDATTEGVQGSEDYVMVVHILTEIEHIVSGSINGKVALWKTENGSLVYGVDVHYGIILSLAFTHDEKLIASASADHTICILRTDNGSSVAMLKGHTDEVHIVQFSSDDNLLVSASPDAQVIIWDVSMKKPKHSLIHSAGVVSASFSPDDKLICSGTLDGEIHIWNVEIGDRVAILKDNPSPILSVMFSSNGRWLASWFENEAVKVWKVEGSNFQIWPYHDWRLDQRTESSSGEEKELVKYDDLLPAAGLYHLQEDGWVTLPHTGKHICWVPATHRQSWLRTSLDSRKGIFAISSQAGALTIVNLTSTLM
ncbi:WD40-repeat-containing domain protein [Mycena olivaceomarginata]|nr:WD40-repeat-containing domain protein [Mycena olivaceomarginata]